jgi:Cation transporter/ATPase, N-terminus
MAAREETAWHRLSADEATSRLGADPQAGLDRAEVERRRAQYGPIVSVVELQEFSTGIVIIGLAVLNAIPARGSP